MSDESLLFDHIFSYCNAGFPIVCISESLRLLNVGLFLAELSYYAILDLGDNCIQNFHLGRYIVGYTVGNLVLWRRARRKT